MKSILAFVLGMIEFRSSVTANLEAHGLQEEYDWGREWAHRLTFRYFEEA